MTTDTPPPTKDDLIRVLGGKPDTLTVLTELRDRAEGASSDLRTGGRLEEATGVDLILLYINEEIRKYGGQQ